MKADSVEALRQALPTLLGNLDDATFEAIRPHLRWDWVERAGGEVLFHEGEPSDSIYLVISGRLQASLTSSNGQPQVVGEIGRGESVGEMGAFTGKPRQATVTALRDTVLARIELSVFHAMLTASPALALNLNRVIIERLERRNTSPRALHNVTNIAVLSVSDGLNPSSTLQQLVAQLQSQDRRVLHLTTAMIDEAAGRPNAAQAADDDPKNHRWLVNYLDGLEARYSMVFYQADAGLTPWTRRCLRVADEVMLLADATASPRPSEVEQVCLAGGGGGGATRVRQTLVLLHPPSTKVPARTAKFLDARPGVRRHFHVRLNDERHVARLARLLSNQAIGLVLAGGGARGLAHIGVYRALQEAGVCIDSVGGTSIGSVMGASIAMDWPWKRVYDENKGPFGANPTRDYNLLPLVSLLSGRKLKRILDATPIANMDVEDLWLPFFCVSCNFTQACEHVHTRGNLERAVMASMAIPGVFPPIVQGNDLLVDGGLFNNMPVDLMAATGVRTILAVDLRRQDEPRGQLQFDTVPGTWALLLDRLRPRHSRRYPIPSMLALLISTPTLNSAHKTRALADDVDLLFKPDVGNYGMLEWRSYDKLVDEGYRHGKEILARHWPLPSAGRAASAESRAGAVAVERVMHS